jgi:hypothetical protein
MVEDVLKAL